MCLQDYHRFHLPVGGTIRSIRHVRGKLYTVNPIAVASTYANVFTQVRPLHSVWEACSAAPCTLLCAELS